VPNYIYVMCVKDYYLHADSSGVGGSKGGCILCPLGQRIQLMVGDWTRGSQPLTPSRDHPICWRVGVFRM
jgi:hypothetical protein